MADLAPAGLNQIGILTADQSAHMGIREDSEPVTERAGLRVTLRRKVGLTDPKHLLIPFHFQCPPTETFGWAEEYAHNDYATLRSGTLSRAAGRGLATVSFNTLFVAHTGDDAPVMSENNMNWAGYVDPFWMTEELRNLMRTGTPFWLYVGMPNQRYEFDVKMLATLRSMRVEERAGEPEAKYADMAFTEYRQTELERRRSRPGPRSHKAAKKRVIVLFRREELGEERVGVRGLPNFNGRVSLARLSQALWGFSSGWRELAKANKITKVGGSSHDDLLDYMVKNRLKQIRLEIPPAPEISRDELVDIWHEARDY